MIETKLSEHIEDEVHLEALLATPSPQLIDFISALQSPLVILGASGKMGPSLAALARNAADAAGHPLEIIAVSRFSDSTVRDWLTNRGIRTQSCDLLNASDVARLPDSTNVIFMAGRKFGTSDAPELTWATNTIAPIRVAERYRGARIVVLSTGTVYPLVGNDSGGSKESDGPGPIGEYANACLARERLFEYYCHEYSSPTAILRLNYAVEPRYGVLVDIGEKVFRGLPVDLTTGYLNCIWQGDANEMALRALGEAAQPAKIVNLTGLDTLSVRQIAERFGEYFGKPSKFSGVETNRAYLNNASLAASIFGKPSTPIDDVIRWTAHWIADGMRLLGKPTHFEVQDGKY